MEWHRPPLNGYSVTHITAFPRAQRVGIRSEYHKRRTPRRRDRGARLRGGTRRALTQFANGRRTRYYRSRTRPPNRRSRRRGDPNPGGNGPSRWLIRKYMNERTDPPVLLSRRRRRATPGPNRVPRVRSRPRVSIANVPRRRAGPYRANSSPRRVRSNTPFAAEGSADGRRSVRSRPRVGRRLDRSHCSLHSFVSTGSVFNSVHELPWDRPR